MNIQGRALLGRRITQTANDLENKQHELANSVDKCLHVNDRQEVQMRAGTRVDKVKREKLTNMAAVRE